MTEHADRVAEIREMLDVDDPGTHRGDLQSACWSLLDEVDRLHSWSGLLSLLDEHWPEETFPALTDDAARDTGPRLVAALRRAERYQSAHATALVQLSRAIGERDALRAQLDAMTTEYGHRWGTGDITNHGTDREQAEQMVRRALACNHGPGVKFDTTHALMARQVTGWAEIEEAGDGV